MGREALRSRPEQRALKGKYPEIWTYIFITVTSGCEDTFHKCHRSGKEKVAAEKKKRGRILSARPNAQKKVQTQSKEFTI